MKILIDPNTTAHISTWGCRLIIKTNDIFIASILMEPLSEIKNNHIHFVLKYRILHP